MLAVTPALDDSMISTSEETVTAPPPRRNLTEAFEELFDDKDDATAGSMLSPRVVTPKYDNTDCLISPTGVAELPVVESSWPGLDLHPILQKELSQAVVDRVSFYAIIHDINKECTAMAANDPVQTNSSQTSPIQSPALVAAVKGLPTEESPSNNDSVVKLACIDEEQWLLSTISTRSSQEIRSCPETFSQAMGEKEYENPVSSIAGGSRTQLWKPSRSWWEAKSGKNPWIEPNSHNKRWRYLWPLIHYHKFLAKCIKKLKRNGVDVKQTVSPVAVFLREEVCAVSDHLAAVSLFGSDEWMECLQLFQGWSDTHPESEQHLRAMISGLKLRALLEPGDVDSPLLRNQIDEQFLRTMAAARLEMRDKTEVNRSTKAKRPTPVREVSASTHGQPPIYPRPQGSPPQHSVPKQVPAEFSAEAGMRRPRYGYPPPTGNWGYHHGYDQQPPPGYEQPPPQQPFVGDNSSVQSGISLDSYHQQYPNYPMYPPGHMNPYYPAGPSPQFLNPSDQSQSTTGYEHTLVFDQTHGWIDPAMAYALHQQAESAGYYVARPPPSPAMAYTTDDSTASWQGHANYATNEQTPYKYDPNTQQPQQHSPYWGHLDRATIDMGLATPAKASPSTPRRGKGKPEDKRDDHEGEAEKSESVDCEEKENGFAANAQPLLLRHNQYYGYGPYAGAPEGGYGPPSPATQFMMSPQAGFAFNYGYGFSSPHRNSANARSTPRSSKKTLVLDSPPATTTAMAPPSPVRNVKADRESPSTVDTTTETTSLEEAAAA